MPRLQPYAYNAWEIEKACEDGDCRYGRSWYNLAGEEIVDYPPYDADIRLSDFRLEGRRTVFPEKEDVPYLIEHPTHSRFGASIAGAR